MAYDILRKRMVAGDFSCGIGSTLDDMEKIDEMEKARVEQAKLEAQDKAAEAQAAEDAKRRSRSTSSGAFVGRGISGADRDRQVEACEDGSKFC
jgi:hypothetical protein